jgi:hypothetical protein
MADAEGHRQLARPHVELLGPLHQLRPAARVVTAVDLVVPAVTTACPEARKSASKKRINERTEERKKENTKRK